MAASDTDQQIRQNVWDEISHDVRIDASDVTVIVTAGVVTLQGTVPTYDQKQTAGADAGRIKGVVGVENQLMVHRTSLWSDAEIQRIIRHQLAVDSRITDFAAVDAAVQGGVVTLTGTVPSYQQRTAVEDDAWAAPGVIDVVDDLVVRPPQARGAAAIAADVQRALANDSHLPGARIAVSVVDGVVYLRGTVRTYDQIDQATIDAWRVPGVANVVSELRVG
jgi:osmotically-inducible protein OsmY